MENKPYQFELDGVGEILDDDTGEVIWKSDSSGLNIVAPVLGRMIERYENFF